MRLINADSLKSDFQKRLRECEKWRKKSKDYSNIIRATATRDFVLEVIMTINNAPTVQPFEPDYVGVERLKARQRGYEEGYRNGREIGRPKGKWEYICTLPVIRKCSICGVEQNGEVTIYDNFCPNCGAQMER